MSRDRATRRWIPVPCAEHGFSHGLTPGATVIAIKAGQDGDLVTTGGSPRCFMPYVIEAHVARNGRNGTREINSMWKVSETDGRSDSDSMDH
jgi:hypothetical protein